MVCDGPDPPENDPHDLTPPPRHDLLMNGNPPEDSDDENNEYFGYEPLPQGPDAVLSEHDSDDEREITSLSPMTDVPIIEPMENVLARDVWSTPRPNDSIQMDNEKAQEVINAMANFALPQTSIPEWAQSISEEQWKQTLIDRIAKLKSDR